MAVVAQRFPRMDRRRIETSELAWKHPAVSIRPTKTRTDRPASTKELRIMNDSVAPELTFARARRLKVSKPLWITLVVVAVFAVCLPLVTWWYLLRTDYAPGFRKTEFDQLKSGDALNAVINRLKAPFNFVVVSERQDDSRYQPQYFNDVTALSKWTNDNSVVLILNYSKPRNAGGDYRAREVWIRKRVMQETRAYNYWD